MALLSFKQKLFIADYLKHGNATLAARAAGYAKKTANRAGSRLLSNKDIQAAVNKSLKKATVKAELTAADILKALRQIAFADISKAFNSSGRLKNIHKIPKSTRIAIGGLEPTQSGTKLKFNDRLRALEMLAKHFKLLTDVHEVAPKDGEGPMLILNMPDNGRRAK